MNEHDSDLLARALITGIEAGVSDPEITPAYIDLKERVLAVCPPDADLPDAIGKLEKQMTRGRRGWLTEEAAHFPLTEHPDIFRAVNALLKQVRKQQTAAATGGSAAAAGDGNVAVGKRGVHAQNAHVIVTGDGNSINIEPKENGEAKAREAEARSLKTAYLNHLLEKTCRLDLAGIDPTAAVDQQDACLDLPAVYTALLTRAGEGESRMARAPDAAEKRLSALALLDRHSRLVLLGDPGSGKTTFVHFIALSLAGAGLEDDPEPLKRLTSPLPKDDGTDGDESQPWRHGALLPVCVVLRDFVARGLDEEKDGAELLWDFIAFDLTARGLVAFMPHLRRELIQTGGLVMLDGLDEVPDAGRLREQVKTVVEDFAAACPNARILVTSRTYAYQKQAWRLRKFTEGVLAPFSPGQIRRFIDQWYAHAALLRDMAAGIAKTRAEQLKNAVFQNPRLRELSERPLLLTFMASLHAWREGSLPDERQRLYKEMVDLLLDRWEQKKIHKKPDAAEQEDGGGLGENLGIGKREILRLLEKLAFDAHAGQPDLRGTANIAEKELVSGLIDLSGRRDLRPALVVDYLGDRIGILVSRGNGVHTFPHRSFQEYLAACHLNRDPRYPGPVAELARRDPDRWREVALLAAAKAADGFIASIWLLVDALCPDPPGDGKPDLPDTWGAHLAGHALAETLSADHVETYNHRKLVRVKTWLKRIIHDGLLPATERALAGIALARLGDDRKEIMTVDGMLFCHVPEGAFWMGSDKDVDPDADRNEMPRHSVTLTAFFMAKYPVTQAQFAAFVDDGGYGEEGFWPEAVREGFWKEGMYKSDWETAWRGKPSSYGNPFDLPNHPIIGVTWYEALAFCRWLTAKWRRDGVIPENWHVMLPSEAEWEKAARGGDLILETPAILSAGEAVRMVPVVPTKPHDSSGIRPWGNTRDAERANVKESGIGGTSTPGAFASGRTVYGCEEMIGNVYEWTRSRDLPYPCKPDDGRETIEKITPTTLIRLRGASFFSNWENARCACRYWYIPCGRDWDGGFRVALLPIL